MKKRFYFEIIVGIICLVAVIIAGKAGFAVFALFALYPLVAKKKADEREYQLFYKTGNVTLSICFLICVAIYLFQDVNINAGSIGELWLFLLCASYLIVHGIIGLVLFRN
jgi:hypothetical protein